MPTWRKFHVKTTDSLDLNDMPDDFTRLMWCLLPLKSCQYGRGIDLPQWIKAQLFPLRSDVTLEKVKSAMRWYHDRRMIRRYVVEGRPYYQIENWITYQGNTEREAKSSFPAPRKDSDVDSDVDVDVDVDACQNTNSGVSQELVRSNEKPTLHSGSHYELPPEDTPNWQHNEERRVIIAALASIVKEVFTVADPAVERDADALIADGVTEADIRRFTKWWKAHGHYEGPPALKSVMQNIKASMPTKSEAIGLTDAQIQGRVQQ